MTDKTTGPDTVPTVTVRIKKLYRFVNKIYRSQKQEAKQHAGVIVDQERETIPVYGPK